MGIGTFLVFLQVATPAAGALDRALSQIFVVEVEQVAAQAESEPDRIADTRARRQPGPFAPEIDVLAPAPAPSFAQGPDERPAALSPCTPPTVCAADGQLPRHAMAALSPPEGRGVLVPLYASFAVLQALDLHSTRVALARGAVERNPLAAGLVNRPAAFIAVKAGAVAGTVYLAEQVRPHSRIGAIIVMGALNSLYATVVAHNYRVAARAR
jgi:hypothetical protein